MGRPLRFAAASAASAALGLAVFAGAASPCVAAPVSPGGGLAGLIAGSSAATSAVSPPTTSVSAASSTSASSSATQEARALVNEATGGELTDASGGVVTTLGALTVETPSEDCGEGGRASPQGATALQPLRSSASAAQAAACAAAPPALGAKDGEARDSTGAILATWPS